MSPEQQTVLELKQITKRFPGVVANSEINFDLKKGEVHTLLGENGAGKSTLMNIIAGLYPPDEGEIFVNGQLSHFLDPGHAISAGIGMVHQHFMLIRNHTVAENIILGTPQNFHLNFNQIARDIAKLSAEYGLHVDPTQKIQDLSVGEQQRVEILKVLYRGARILILDEPTAVLSPQESDALFEIIRRMVKIDHSVVFISHKMKEVMSLSDRITILGKGKVLATLHRKDTDAGTLAKIMMGKKDTCELMPDPPVETIPVNPQIKVGHPVITLKNICAKNELGQQVLNNLNLTVNSGEIFGLAGVSGNGQSVLAKVLTGLLPYTDGEYHFEGKLQKKVNVSRMIGLGVGHIPEDRKKFGIAKGLSIGNNFLIRDYNNPDFYQRKLVSWKKVFSFARDKMLKFDIRAPSEKTLVGKLSGGNIQKTILSREISRPLHFLLANQPIRGLDINASQEIQRQIHQAKVKGLAVLLISEDLDELMVMSDRIGVIYNGAIVHIMPRQEATVEKIGQLMTGMQD